MTDAIVIAFYVWLAISAVWLVVRLVQRRRHPEAVVDDVPNPDSAHAVVDGAPAAGPTPAASGTGSEPAASGTGSGASPADAPPAPAPDTHSGAAAGAPAAAPSPGGAAPEVGAHGGAGSGSDADTRRAAVTPPQTLADLLIGIDLPSELVPYGAADHPDPDRYVALLTAAAPPEEVGPAIADELERLGFALHALSDDEAVARRGDDVISLRIHPRADTAHVQGRRLFPLVSAETVAVELWVGAGPHPRTT